MPESTGSLRQIVLSKYNPGARTITLDTTFGDQVTNLLSLINLETIALTAATLDPPASTSPSPDTWALQGTATIWGVAGCAFRMDVSAGTNNVAEVKATSPVASITLAALADAVVPIDTKMARGLSAIVFTGGTLTAIEPDGTLSFFASIADGWSPFGLSSATLETIQFGFATVVDPTSGAFSKALLTATLVLNTTKIPLEIDIPLSGGSWSAGIVPPGVTVNALGDIAELIGGNDFSSVIPSQLLSMMAIHIQSLILLFDPSVPSWAGIDVNLSTANPWPIAANIEVESVGLLLSVRPANTPTVTGMVTGSFKVDILEFQVAVPIPLAGIIQISGRTSQPLPGFGAFASLVDAPFAAALPDGIATLGSFQINSLFLNYDLTAGAVSALGFQIAAASSWTLIPKYLSLDNLAFGIEAQKLGSTWGIQGNASGTIVIAGIQVSVAVQGGQGAWLVKLTSPLVLPGIVELTNLFGGDDASSALPSGLDSSVGALTISKYEMNFGGTTNSLQSLSLSFGTTNAWKFWDPYFILNSLTVDLSVTGPTGARVLDAVVAGSLTVAGVTILLSATKPASSTGWTFFGGLGPGQSLAAADLVNYIFGQFKLTAPTALSSFVLNDLAITFVTDTKAFTFHISGTFQLAGQDSSMTLDIAVTSQGQAGFILNITGDFYIGTAHFTLTLDKTDAASVLTAVWDQTNAPIGFGDIANAFGFTMPAIPEGLDLGLTGAGFTYNFDSGALAFSATSKHYGQISFASTMVNNARVYVFDLEVTLNIKLSDIPVAGSQIPASVDAGIKMIEIAYTTGKLVAADVSTINTSLVAIKANPMGFTTLDQGMAFFGQLTLGADQFPLQIPVSSSTASQAALTSGTGTTTTPPPSTSPGKWFDVGKSFGPLQIDRVGVQYENRTLMFALDAGLTFGPLAFSMSGLAVGSPLTSFTPVFSINGLGLSYNKPPLEIVGAILRVMPPPAGVNFQFDGMVVLKAETFSLAAIASYAQMTTGESSLFVFAQLDYPLGGPPAFFVTGLMAGFGFNRTLVIPGQDEVNNFPLLMLAAAAVPGQPPAEPMDVLAYLEGTKAPKGGTAKAWITAKSGEYWLAAGLEFTSFELVDTKAMLVVEFGESLLIALLGLSTMQLPQPEVSSEAYAYVELMIRVVIAPDEGYFSATAILSKNSYVISPDCHLTGGFAFVIWFGKNPNAGQFVITLGGYHPAFNIPPNFPLVPRLGFNWAVSDVVSIKGDAYFALTTSCIMAGGGLEVLFHDGDLQAWFTAHADFLISWHPFFYLAEIAVSIGASYRLNLLFCHKTISISLGAQLNLWGPPTGGKVRIDLVVISFTVNFGSDSAGAQKNPLVWDEFKSLLPDSTTVCRIAVTDGLYKTQDDATNSSGKLWVVRAKSFSFQTQSAIPASHLQYGSAAPNVMTAASGGIAIKPMNQTSVTSTHTLKIFKGSSTTPVDSTGWSMNPSTQPVPAALWGTPPTPFTQMPARPAADIIPGQASGYEVAAPQPSIGDTRGPLALALLSEEYLSPAGQSPLSQVATPSSAYLPTFVNTTVGLIQQINTGTAQSSRCDLFAALSASSLFTGINGDLTQLNNGATHFYSDSPMQQN
jgi:hypothetical protein